MRFQVDDLTGIAIQELLREHLRGMAQLSPPESVHALDIEALRSPEITFWTAWEGDQLLGCGALKELDSTHAEVKSMRTSSPHRQRGVAKALLTHMLDVARLRGYRQVSLETGSMQGFAPAHQLYASFGFADCAPFSNYRPDPNSVFMTKRL